MWLIILDNTVAHVDTTKTSVIDFLRRQVTATTR